jgi:hypothetical protein
MNNETAALPKRQGMAITSLILGILSVACFGLFTGVPAIILGHIAHGRARKSPEQYAGGGLAIAGFVMGYASLMTMMILAGMLLPALAKAKDKAQSIKCINNMKNIGLAFRIFATDHEDRFPFSPATNQAGVQLEAVATDSVSIFQALSNELGTPALLVCPGDTSKHPATSMATLTPANISYELETGPQVTESNPEQVLARCPVHGHELFCDGSVQQTRRRLGR